MFYTVYKITNQIDGKFYIGSHKTKDLNDSYMGSGKYLKAAQAKYGIENFKKEILFVFDTPEEMYAKEGEIVNEEFLVDQNTYNLKVGGFGGWDYINSDEANRIAKNRKARTRANQTLLEVRGHEFQRQISSAGGHALKEAHPDLASNIAKRGHEEGWFSFKDKTHSSESKKKIGIKNSIAQSGSKNSQYGTRWIHSVVDRMSKKIRKDQPLPDGWFEGRKMKFG